MTTVATHEVFVYLSDWMGRTVYDSSQHASGKIVDVLAQAGHMFPPIRGIVIRLDSRKVLYRLAANELNHWLITDALTVDPTKYQPLEPNEDEFLIRDWLWDRQIVDISGAKVKRVNDVQMIVGDVSYIVHVDVGFLGLARRLGFERSVKTVAKLFGKSLQDELISWKYVTPVKAQSGAPLRLSVQLTNLRNLHPAELADVLEELDKDERTEIVRAVGAETAAAALEVADEDVQKSVLESLTADESADILEEMDLQVAADVLEVVEEELAEAMLAAVEPETRDDITELAAHKDETAGSAMSSDFIQCHPDDTASEVLEKVRILAREIESFLYIYVVDDNEEFKGVVSLRAILTSSPSTPVHTIMHSRIISVTPDEPLEDVAELFSTYDFGFCPVVKDGRVLGVISLKHSFEELLPHFWKKRND
ncbi:MAG: CBS domain-containing protein [bacterium]|nr:CBS domain-containing protein [bacterium]